ncbi:precorrin-8X methylmutase [Herbaspirillum sp. RTI4]|uniref:precorrin-8X methylmutase n=1 Tax=Herbaspirillum sp. RTI4 TaxID=3048640 RepID=UPI002AB3E066|nr:precorrin-8X methylmutase [Herbaspirillum sp. RTI4]MDY7579546.1 precorrin-8X methylmutase [Herbaspirillum sp. RTI4]MEA9981825.1 precorrin-8X methylmutase [Herbaspirillum sp. RTI4]
MSLSAPAEHFGIVVAGHGSRDADAVREFETLVELIRARAPQQVVTHGYLEFSSPTIAEAIAANLAAGSKQIAMVPGVLLAARHAKNDMPAELLTAAQTWPGIDFHFGAPLKLHPQLLQLAQERIVTAEAKGRPGISRADTLLVLVGRGTTDPDANGEVAKLARMLEEGMGFGASLTCYSGSAKPLVADGLRAAAQLGFARLIVLPFFLFDGVLVKRIYAASEDARQREPELDIVDAGYFGPDPLVADVLIDRAREAVLGRADMNCTLCKYRVQIVGFEEQVGEPQRAHHLQVRGLLQKEAADASLPATSDGIGALPRYVPHPIEAESFRIIAAGRDWSMFPAAHLTVLQRLVHTSGDFGAVDDIYLSPGAVETGIRALLRCKRIVTDVTMVQTGLKRALLEQLEIETWCGVHDRETHLMAASHGITRSAAGIRRAFEKFGNDIVLAIGDAPTAIAETTRLIREQGWRPQLVIGLPVGFVGTRESKEDLRRCLQVPRITNSGTRGGSPWAASVVNGMMIDAQNQLADSVDSADSADGASA